MVFASRTKRMKNGTEILELRRLAISDSAPPNTATKVISYMQKEIKKVMPDIKTLISYQDTEVHKGTIYKASNWTMAAETPLMDWSTSDRKRNKLQSTASKIRWEYDLEKRRKPYKNVDN